MSIIEVGLSCYYILVFDDVKINIGFVFNRILGMFIVLIDGVFVFIWIIFLDRYSYINLQIVVNIEVFISMIIDSDEVSDFYFLIGVIVVNLNCGDLVYF